MIRLGSLAGYPFEGPRVLAGWTPPPVRRGVRDPLQARPGEQAGAVRGHLRRARRRPVRRALPVPAPERPLLGPPGRLPVEGVHRTYEVPGGTPPHREQISRELTAIYHPGCNTQQYDQSWREEWIGGPST